MTLDNFLKYIAFILIIIFIATSTVGCFKNSIGQSYTEQSNKETKDNAPTPYPDEDLSSEKDTNTKVQSTDKEAINEKEFEDNFDPGEITVKNPMISVEEMPKEEESSEEADEDHINYVGDWQRIGLFVDGSAHEFAPDILVFQKDSFMSSTAICTAQGKISVSGNQLTMYDLTSNCPNPSPGSITYTLIISDDDNTLTMTTVYGGVEIREVYQRNK